MVDQYILKQQLKQTKPQILFPLFFFLGFGTSVIEI
jgi:hypothetical protein